MRFQPSTHSFANPSDEKAKVFDKTAKYEQKYCDCKKKREAKGKKAYPADPSTSMFSTNCHSEYKKWQEWKARKDKFPKNSLSGSSSALVASDVTDSETDNTTLYLAFGAVAVVMLGGAYYLRTR